MNLTNEFYLISKSLSWYHGPRGDKSGSKCIHCCNPNLADRSILCLECHNSFRAIHDVSVDLWGIAAKCDSFDEFKLKAILYMLGGM